MNRISNGTGGSSGWRQQQQYGEPHDHVAVELQCGLIGVGGGGRPTVRFPCMEDHPPAKAADSVAFAATDAAGDINAETPDSLPVAPGLGGDPDNEAHCASWWSDDARTLSPHGRSAAGIAAFWPA